jgi:hypothetical protein
MPTCASCGNEAREGARFCGSCGAPFVAADPPTSVEPPPESPRRKGRGLLWAAVGAGVALLVVGSAVAAALSLTGGGDSTEAATTSTSSQVVTSDEDCLALGRVVADFTVGANAEDLVPIALDINASDYLVDRDFLDSYADRAPGEIRPDVVRLALFVGRYATAMQAAGLEPGAVPPSDQAGDIRAASQIGSVEQDQLPGSIAALGSWAANGCTGGRPPTDVPDATISTTEAVTSEPGLLAATDEEVTAAVNYAMSQRTEWELGSSPLGAEVRDCRNDRDVSEDSLLAPGGRVYTCEVWFEDELWSDAGLAAIDSDGNVYVAP